jgi:cyclopropane fatty-acyl-phospholipid synthase-like methyltransferase
MQMQNDKPDYKRFDHNEHAKSRPADDFWGQIRRTVQGEPVSDEQIRMIVDAIHSALRFKPDDALLDLACGNGALSRLLFDSIREYLGVDFSEHLISVAKKNFEKLPNYQFMTQGAAEYVRQEKHPERFTKVLCYGSFSYFPAADAAEVLRTLHDKFTNVQTVFIGNLPDKDRAVAFYKIKMAGAEEMSDSSSQIGIWRTQDEFAELAGSAGWKVKFSVMPAEYYAGYYRYDVLLSR